MNSPMPPVKATAEGLPPWPEQKGSGPLALRAGKARLDVVEDCLLAKVRATIEEMFQDKLAAPLGRLRDGKRSTFVIVV